jgi:cation transport ATPase
MDLRQETASAIQTGAGLIVGVLVVTGIAGTVYKVIAPGGWVAQAFGHSAKAGFSLLLAIALLLGFAVFSRTWTPSRRHRNFTANLVVALFALAGAVYLAHFWATGKL